MKHSTKNKILSVITAASMIVSLVPAPLYAAEADIVEADDVYVEETAVTAEEQLSDMEDTMGGVILQEEIISGQGSSEIREELILEAENLENSLDEAETVDSEEDVLSGISENDPELQEIYVDGIAEAESEPELTAEGGSEQAAEETDYALMNIPYAAFYQAVGTAAGADYDAMSSATNKAGNYGKSGGSFHSAKTAGTAEDGTVAAVGGENGAKNEGVIWPVRINDSAKGRLKELGGTEITSESKVTTATLGRGSTSASYLVGYETLTEAPAYSYYYLDSEPANYLTLDVDSQNQPQFSAGKSAGVSGGTAEIADSYGTHHADVQLVIETVSQELSDKLVNAVVLTTSDGSTGLVHIDNIWAANELGWNVSAGPDLGGKTITGIRYYCSVKDDSVGEDNSEAPDYQNYVYEYSVNKAVKKYDNAESLKAEFDGSSSVTVSGLPADIQNPKAAVYHTDGGRPATLTYLTPATTDGDGNMVPEEVEIKNGKIALASEPVDQTEYTIAVSSENYAFATFTVTYTAPETEKPGPETEAPEAEYALMNIPYAAFYQAVGTAAGADYDAMSSATNKAGNYGKSGGSFHSAKTAGTAEDGTVAAVGGENGAKNEGVIWPVKINESAKGKLSAFGGTEITSESKVTTATLGRGSTSASYLVGYETLTEAPAYSYYYLSGEPANYLTLDVDSQNQPQFSAGKSAGVSGGTAEITDSYGTHHADVQLVIETASQELSDKLVNAVVLTTSDGSTGLVHIDNIWAANELGWNVSAGPDLGGKTITGIRYYCSVKDDSVGEDNSEAPDYQNYVYEYSVNKAVKKYDNAESLKAEFDGSSSVTVSGLPEDIQNPKAAVYHTDGGRPATLTYLTPATTDGDGNMVPEEVEIKNGKIALASEPVDQTEYTVAVSSDNYAFATFTVTYTAPETEKPGPETEAPETEKPGPETEAPETEKPGPETEAPETEAPETEKPGPETEAPETEKPGPETEAPETDKPGTDNPETEVKYTVTYNANGQKNVRNMPSDSTSYEAGKSAAVKGTPVSKTSFFAGWNTQANGKGTAYQAGDKISMTASVTLYAQWKDTYTASKLTYKVSGYNQAVCTGTSDKNQTSVKVPDNIKYSGITYKVTSIAGKAFANRTKLKTVTVGNNVKTIGNKAFFKCAKLSKVMIGTGLVTIGKNVFNSAKKGCVITISSKKLSTVKTAVNKGTENMTVKVPKGKLKAYKSLLQKTAKDVTVEAK